MAQLRSFFTAAPKREAQELYIALVEQSRKAFFYTVCGVPDTLDGRFEIILLHVFLKLHLLKDEGGRQALSRRLLECLFDDMDRNLREMGVGDMGVGKRVKVMSRAAFGRLEVYTQAIADDTQMAAALRRNVYRGADTPQPHVTALLNYVRDYGSSPAE